MKTKTYLQLTAQQVIASLPPKCYTVTEHEGKEVLIAIIAGVSGFQVVPTYSYTTPKDAADFMNNNLNITEAQVKAMVAGSQFGWHCPAADPNNPLNQ